jgi:hypothetical protein
MDLTIACQKVGVSRRSGVVTHRMLKPTGEGLQMVVQSYILKSSLEAQEA